MKHGISNSKAAFSEWVTSGNSPLPVIESTNSANVVIDDDTEPVMMDKTDPILLALEKESQAFDPSVYLTKGDPLSAGE